MLTYPFKTYVNYFCVYEFKFNESYVATHLLEIYQFNVNDLHCD